MTFPDRPPFFCHVTALDSSSMRLSTSAWPLFVGLVYLCNWAGAETGTTYGGCLINGRCSGILGEICEGYTYTNFPPSVGIDPRIDPTDEVNHAPPPLIPTAADDGCTCEVRGDKADVSIPNPDDKCTSATVDCWGTLVCNNIGTCRLPSKLCVVSTIESSRSQIQLLTNTHVDS